MSFSGDFQPLQYAFEPLFFNETIPLVIEELIITPTIEPENGQIVKRVIKRELEGYPTLERPLKKVSKKESAISEKLNFQSELNKWRSPRSQISHELPRLKSNEPAKMHKECTEQKVKKLEAKRQFLTKNLETLQEQVTSLHLENMKLTEELLKKRRFLEIAMGPTFLNEVDLKPMLPKDCG